jgi:hypothetical protein
MLTLKGTTGNGTLASTSIKFLTGNNGATTAVTILNNGNVGIGTTEPTGKLHVIGSNGVAPANTSLHQLRLESSAAAAVGVGPSILFRGQTGNSTTNYGFAAIQGAKESIAASNYDGYLAFFTQNGSGDALSERLRITSNGNVGIGTTSPGGKLDISGTANPVLKVTRVAAGAGIYQGARFVRDLGGNAGASNGIGLYFQATNNAGAIKEAGFLGGGLNSIVSGAETGEIILAPSHGSQDAYQRRDFVLQSTGSNSGDSQLLIAGNVGIGTTAPTTLLSVVSQATVTTRGISNYQYTTDAASALMSFNKARGTSASPTAVVSGDYTGIFQFKNYDGSGNFRSNASFGYYINDTVGANNVPGELFFAVSNTDDNNSYLNGTVRMVIKSTGNVGIGTTTPGQLLTVAGNAQFTGITSGAFGSALNITSDGVLTTDSSDIALKTNLELFGTSTGTSTLDKILQLKPYNFNWKSDPDGRKDIGLIAQDVESIFPEITFTNKVDGYKGINYSRLPVILIKAIQELSDKVSSIFNGVANIFVGSVKVKERLCIGETCVDEAMLKDLLQRNAVVNIVPNTPSEVPAVETIPTEDTPPSAPLQTETEVLPSEPVETVSSPEETVINTDVTTEPAIPSASEPTETTTETNP